MSPAASDGRWSLVVERCTTTYGRKFKEVVDTHKNTHPQPHCTNHHHQGALSRGCGYCACREEIMTTLSNDHHRVGSVALFVCLVTRLA